MLLALQAELADLRVRAARAAAELFLLVRVVADNVLAAPLRRHVRQVGVRLQLVLRALLVALADLRILVLLVVVLAVLRRRAVVDEARASARTGALGAWAATDRAVVVVVVVVVLSLCK